MPKHGININPSGMLVATVALLMLLLGDAAVEAQTITTGATACYSCLVGTYTDYDGASTCSACGAGYYQDFNASTGCKPCSAGLFCFHAFSYCVYVSVCVCMCAS